MSLRHAAVVLIIDGCSAACFERAETPFLDRMAEAGASTVACVSVHPTVTYTAHTSIVTGACAEGHGIVGNQFYDRIAEEVVDFDRHDVNRFVEVETLFEVIKGTAAAIGEPITRGADFVVAKSDVQSKPLRAQDEYAIEKSIEAVKEFKPLLLIVNMPAMDGFGERFGPLSSDTVEALEKVDELIEVLKAVLDEAYEDYLLTVLADHGMTEVRENVDIKGELSDLNPVVCASHRFAHVYLLEGDVAAAKERLLADGRIELALELAEAGKLALANPRAGDLLVAAKRGYELGPERLRGSHGGVTPEEIHAPLIVNKPEFRDVIVAGVCITDVPSIVLRYLREKSVEAVVREKLAPVDPSHGWEHVKRVLGLATRLALKCGADIESVRLASILHDAERAEDPKAHAESSASFAEKLLTGVSLPAEKVEKVKAAILSHHTENPEKLTTLEEKILWDADKLDALGLVGLARCLQEAGSAGQSIDDAIAHLLRDTKAFSNTMHFDETREMARRKIEKVNRVIEALKEELDSSRFI